MGALPLNQKSRDAITHNGFLTVYEGAVRSAKTVTSLVQFYRRVLTSRDSVFLMSGNTMGSISRNCINGDFGFIAITGGKATQHTDADGNKFLLFLAPTGDKRPFVKIYYCGADNVGSFKKIRGLTIGGWYADEIDLHDREFIETAEARSFAALDRFQIWTLNPNVPGHWIYKERIDKYQGLPGYAWFHFTLDDNPAFTTERKAEIKSQFTGVFYDRYILGKRVRAEGGCYPSFTDDNIITAGYTLTTPFMPHTVWQQIAKDIKFVVIGADVGGNKSASAFAATGYFIKDGKLCAVLLDELHDGENKGAQDFVNNFRVFVERVKAKYKCIDCYFESGEQLIKGDCDALGLVNVYNSVKTPIIDRIRFFDLMFSRGRLFLLNHCTYSIDAVRSAVYNSKSVEEKRLDDGTTDIDSLDAFEYSITPYMEDF